MLAFISRMFGWLGSKLAGLFGAGWLVEVAKWAAIKAVVLSFLAVGIYVVSNNLMVWAVTTILEQTSGQLASRGSFSAASIQLTGLGAYLAGKLLLPQSFSLIVTGFSIRAIRQFLPF